MAEIEKRLNVAISGSSKDWDLKKLDEAIQGLKAYIAELEQKADTSTGKIMPVKSLSKAFDHRLIDIKAYHRNGNYRHSPEIAIANAQLQCDEIWNQVVADHATNLAAIENNMKLTQKISLIMHNIGIPAKITRKDWTGRRRNPKEVTTHAGYIDDLQRHVPVDDEYSIAENRYKAFMADIDRYRKRSDDEKREADRIKAAQQREETKIRVRAALAVKYGLNYDTDLSELLDHLLGLNKYLRLAYYLRKNRGDWNDGYNYAEMGIDSFTVETDIDKAIVADITSHFSDFEDGRVFRDCEWNYDRLFGIVAAENKGLFDDFNQIIELVE